MCSVESKWKLLDTNFSNASSRITWNYCYSWYGDTRVLPNEGITHFWQHQGALKGKHARLTWWIVWAFVLWGIWLHRNEIKFNNKSWDVESIVDTFRNQASTWAKAYVKGFSPSLYAWSLQPKELLKQLT